MCLSNLGFVALALLAASAVVLPPSPAVIGWLRTVEIVSGVLAVWALIRALTCRNRKWSVGPVWYSTVVLASICCCIFCPNGIRLRCDR
jgi:hypothetical protein